MIKVKNEADKAEIVISGTIVDDDEGFFLANGGEADGYQWPSDLKKQLDAISAEKPITVYINSNGGSVSAGVAMANMIKRHKGHTCAIVDGWCCSIATQVFFAADERQIPKNAMLMIHKPSTVVAGDADDLVTAADALDRIQQGLESTYNSAAREGVTPEHIHELTNSGTWMTGEQAAEIFNVDVLEQESAAACLDGADMSKIPDSIKAKIMSAKNTHDDKKDDDSWHDKIKVMLAMNA